jgi:plasmid stability protein
MPSLVINELPGELHAKLTQEAARQQRSVEQQVIQFLEQCLTKAAVKPLRVKRPKELPEPIDLGVQHDNEWIYQAIREGRQ